MKQRVARQAKREAKRSNTRGKANLTVVSNVPDQDLEQRPIGKANTSPIIPSNPNQAKYYYDMQHKGITVGMGEAGSGKTYISVSHAAELLRNKEIDQIVVTRPVLQADEDLGFLPGTIAEKFAPYFEPVYEVLKERLGASFLEYCLRPGIDKIVIAPFAYLRGRTFKNCIVILDEAQNTTRNQMKLLITRIGMNASLIINGDVTQCDLPNHKTSGLLDLSQRIDENDLVGITTFTREDSVRSEICQYALTIYK